MDAVRGLALTGNASDQVWIDYDAQVRALFPPRVDALAVMFERHKFVRGLLALPNDAAVIVSNAERIEFNAQSNTEGFHTSDLNAEKIADTRAASHFRVIAVPLWHLLAECITQLQTPVAQALGTPWSVLNVRVWTTPPMCKIAGMYLKHRDGFPWQIWKVMIYFTPMDVEHGGLEVEQNGVLTSLYGPAGSWVLFYNSTLPHRGAAGRTLERASAEITLARTQQFDLALHEAGLNAHFPLAPPAL